MKDNSEKYGGGLHIFQSVSFSPYVSLSKKRLERPNWSMVIKRVDILFSQLNLPLKI